MPLTLHSPVSLSWDPDLLFLQAEEAKTGGGGLGLNGADYMTSFQSGDDWDAKPAPLPPPPRYLSHTHTHISHVFLNVLHSGP